MSIIAIANMAVVCWNLLAIILMYAVALPLMGASQKTFDYSLGAVVAIWLVGIPIVWVAVYRAG